MKEFLKQFKVSGIASPKLLLVVAAHSGDGCGDGCGGSGDCNDGCSDGC
jgi:hypothetical protein